MRLFQRTQDSQFHYTFSLIIVLPGITKSVALVYKSWIYCFPFITACISISRRINNVLVTVQYMFLDLMIKIIDCTNNILHARNCEDIKVIY